MSRTLSAAIALLALAAIPTTRAAHAAAPGASHAARAATPGTHTAHATTTPLIPRAVFFGNSPRDLPRLSPDGAQVSWLAPGDSGVMNVWATPAGHDAPRPITHEAHRPIYTYEWAGDGKHILYLQDSGGDENPHLFIADLAGGAVRDLTPYPGVRAQNVLVDPHHPDHIFVALNRRDGRVFDMHRIDLASGNVTLEAQNPGDVLTWSTDWEFAIRAATAFDPRTGNSVVRIRDAVDQPWRDLVVMPFEQALFNGQVVGGSLVAAFDSDNRGLIIHSALHSNTGRLVRVDAKTGAELEVLAADPGADIQDAGPPVPHVMLNEKTRRVAAVAFDPGMPYWKFLDAGYAADFARIRKRVAGFPHLLSADRDDRSWIIVSGASDTPHTYYRYDRAKHTLTTLFSDNPAIEKYTLSPKKLVMIPARDGLQMVSYLMLPPGSSGKRVPLVLDIHGGPWFNFDGSYDGEAQLLANRGYAVLQVNYRGSTGYGLKYLNLSTNQWGRGTQLDLYDAVKWAIDTGIADPKRIAAYGWSGGGYATLMSLSQRPELFACGVDGVGPADIATLFQSFPTYWDGILTRWRRRVGDVDHNDSLNRAISPLYHVDTIRAPLLIGQGQNDPRVKIAQADAMVKALRAAGREVTYVVYPDEGHGFARPENNLDYFGRVEEFLAKHLGGRAEPWRKIEGTTAELR
jgi:dipeptidyl aminopeptidase/acylaminoacyl peptidase